MGIGYLAHFNASGGSKSGYAFDLQAGSLPNGLALDPVTGTISGSPAELGTFAGLRVRVTDSAAATASYGPFSITVAPAPALLIAGNPSSSAQVGIYYEAGFTGFDGTGTGYSFSSSGAALPPGLTVSNVGGTGGMLAGTPTRVGTYSGLRIRVTDSASNIAETSAFTITVAPPAGPGVTVSGTVPSGTVGTAYSAQIGAAGGTGIGYAFSISSGSGPLPAGLTLNADGSITGTPTSAGVYQFTVEATDSAGDPGATTFNMTVATPLGLSGIPDGAQRGNPYSFDLHPLTSGGRAPYSYSISSGNLPNGMVLSPSGMVTSPGVTGSQSAATFTVVDIDGRNATAQLVFAVGDAHSEATLTPSTVRSGAAISGTLSTTLVSPGWFFATTPHLDLTASGSTFSGTAPSVSSATDHSIVATASNGSASAEAAPIVLRVLPALSVTSDPFSSISGPVGSPVVPTPASPVPAGLVGSASYALLKNGLPYAALATDCPGLAFNAASGIIAGTPTQTCAVTGVSVRLTDDADGATAELSPSFGIFVSDATAVSTLTSTSKVRSGAAVTGTMSTSLASPGWAFITTPSDLALAPTGSNAFSGTAPSVSTETAYQIVLQAVSGAVHVNAAPLSLTVDPALALSGGPSGTVAGVVGTPIAATAAPAPTGLLGTATYSLVKNGTAYTSLSTDCGLSFAATSGTISGTPNAACSLSSLALKVTDSSDGAVATGPTFALSIAAGTSVAAGSPASGTVGNAYSQTAATASGGSGTYSSLTVNNTSGTLAALGLSVTLSGANVVVSGTPSAAGSWSGTFKVTDSASSSGTSGSVSITVYAALAMASTAPTAVQGSGYSSDLRTSLVSGGHAPYTVALVSGSFPTGLSLSNSTVSGTTGAAASQTTATLKATDSDGRTVQRAVTFPVTVPGSSASAWGYNANGQIGDGTTTQRNSKVSVAGGGSYIALAGGYSHSCGVLVDGTVRCWGSNVLGELGDGTTTQRTTPVAVPGLSNVVKVAAGFRNACAVTSAGELYCWGNNGSGQLGDGTTTNRPSPTLILTGVASVAMPGNSSHTCAVTTAGAAYCWGDNTYGQVGDGTTTARLVPTQVSGLTAGVTSIAVNYSSTCAAVSGAAKCWGYNGQHALGDGTSTNRSTPNQVPGLTVGVTQVTVANYGACALVSGAASCWGNANITGGTQSYTPIQVPTMTSGVTQIAGKADNVCALQSGGVKCWGNSSEGENGNGSTSPQTTPGPVTGLTSGVSEIAAGLLHFLAR